MLPSYIIQFVFSGASSIGSHSKTKGKTIIMISVMDYPMRTKFRKGAKLGDDCTNQDCYGNN